MLLKKKKIYPEYPWEHRRGAVTEGREEKEGQNQKELDEGRLLNIGIFQEYFLVMHSKYLILKTIFCFCNSK